MTVLSTSDFANSNSINGSTGVTSTISSSLDYIATNKYNSSGSNHAVDLGIISANTTMSWNNIDTGFTDASSGNETIKVSVDSGFTLTINVASGASTPSVYNVGLGDASVVVGQRTFTVTSILAGSIVEIFDNEIEDNGDNNTLLGTTLNSSTSFSYPHDGTLNDVRVQVIKTGYKERIEDFTLDAINQSLSMSQTIDNN